MSNVNVFSQVGCIGCKPCEGGAGNIARGTVLWTVGIFTCGMGLIFLPFFKKCQYCGHNKCMNSHYGPDPRNQGPTGAANQQTVNLVMNMPGQQHFYDGNDAQHQPHGSHHGAHAPYASSAPAGAYASHGKPGPAPYGQPASSAHHPSPYAGHNQSTYSR